VLLAYRVALASPRVTAAAIEASEFPSLAEQHSILAVPTILIGDARYEGAAPERMFMERLVAAAAA
jgi:hypothetical protein